MIYFLQTTSKSSENRQTGERSAAGPAAVAAAGTATAGMTLKSGDQF